MICGGLSLCGLQDDDDIIDAILCRQLGKLLKRVLSSNFTDWVDVDTVGGTFNQDELDTVKHNPRLH